MPGGEDGDGAEEPAGQGVLDGGRVPGPLRHSSPAAGGEDEGLSGAGAQTSRHHRRHHHQEHVVNHLLEEKGRQVIYLTYNFVDKLNDSFTDKNLIVNFHNFLLIVCTYYYLSVTKKSLY